MKYCLLFSLAICFLSNANAQSIFDQWTELDEFHDVMASTYHPAEEGDMGPIREGSAEMAVQAESLKNSEIPENFRSEKIQAALNKLETDSQALDQLIREADPTDDQIMEDLEALHDVFHEIVGLCRDEH